MRQLIIIVVVLSVSYFDLSGQRIKDLAYFEGVHEEELVGYGLVTGLAGTGDSYRSRFTVQMVVNMLRRFETTVPETNLRTRNVCAVIVTAQISNRLKPGGNFDVVVSSIGDATSLMGGTLVLTPLLGKDGQRYASSQGPISIGGYDINTTSGSRMAKNHALSGRIPRGGKILNELITKSIPTDILNIFLREPDFTTSNNIAEAVNAVFGSETAASMGATEIRITVPAQYDGNITPFLAAVESIEVQRDVNARVVLNERTGTVVAGSSVRISPVTISHGSLNINIRSFPIISQPNSFSNGETVMFNNLVPSVEQENNSTISIEGASNAQEIASALNSLKVSPRDIIAIFQALKEAGALTAELIII